MMTVPSAGMQRPTLEGIHIRSPEDAHKVFYAVQLGLLPEITRRLDAQERKQLKSGNVYCWADKPAGEVAMRAAAAGSGPQYEFSIERWTEGLSWSASRIRDDFLIYFENEKKKGDKSSSSQRARSLENQVHREGGRDMFIKQTYSAYRCDDFPDNEPSTSSPDASASSSSTATPTATGTAEGTSSGNTSAADAAAAAQQKKKKPRKWHLNAYFTKSTEGNLATIDSIQYLRDLVVPEGMFRSARNSAKKSKAAAQAAAATSASTSASGPGPSALVGAGSASSLEDGKGKRREGAGPQRTYAPFPSGERVHPHQSRPPRPVAPAPGPSGGLQQLAGATSGMPGPSRYEMPPPPVPPIRDPAHQQQPIPSQQQQQAFLPSLDMSMAAHMHISSSAPAGMGMPMGISMDMDVDMPPHSPFGPMPQYGFPSSQSTASSSASQQQQTAMVVDRQSNPVTIDTSYQSHGPRSPLDSPFQSHSQRSPVDAFAYGGFTPAPQHGQTSASFSSLEGALSSPTSPFVGPFGSPAHSHTFSPTREQAYSPTHETQHRQQQMPFGYDQQQQQQAASFSSSSSTTFMGMHGYDYPNSPPAHVLQSPGPSANPSQVVSFASRAHSALSLSPHSHSGSSAGSAGTGRGGTDSPALSDLSGAVSWHTAPTPEPRPGTGSSGGRGSLGPGPGSMGIGGGTASNEDLTISLTALQQQGPLAQQRQRGQEQQRDSPPVQFHRLHLGTPHPQPLLLPPDNGRQASLSHPHRQGQGRDSGDRSHSRGI